MAASLILFFITEDLYTSPFWLDYVHDTRKCSTVLRIWISMHLFLTRNIRALFNVQWDKLPMGLAVVLFLWYYCLYHGEYLADLQLFGYGIACFILLIFVELATYYKPYLCFIQHKYGAHLVLFHYNTDFNPSMLLQFSSN